PTLRPFANMAGNPFLHPTSYYILSAFQHAFSGNNTYHQSAAAVHGAGMKNTLPQFKKAVPSNSFPSATAIPSGHRGYAGSANLPGNLGDPNFYPSQAGVLQEQHQQQQTQNDGSSGPTIQEITP
ncbi:hypothetical protein MKW92_018228, partial [Papaver armeniacum]